MSFAEHELLADAEQTCRVAEGESAALLVRERDLLIDLLTHREPDRQHTGGGFARGIWVATSILRRSGKGPTVVLAPNAQVQRINDELREPLSRLGLRLGFDLIVAGLLDPRPADPTASATADVGMLTDAEIRAVMAGPDAIEAALDDGAATDRVSARSVDVSGRTGVERRRAADEDDDSAGTSKSEHSLTSIDFTKDSAAATVVEVSGDLDRASIDALLAGLSPDSTATAEDRALTGEPLDHPDDVWADLWPIRPGMVALLGRTADGEPGTLPDEVDAWLARLPAETPVLRCWEPADPSDSEAPAVDRVRRTAVAVRPSKRFHRPKESAEAAAQLLRAVPPVVAITGRSGTGRSSLIGEIAGQLALAASPMTMRYFDLGGSAPIEALHETMEFLSSNEARVPEVIVIDDFDLIARLGTSRGDYEFVEYLAATARLRYYRFLLVINEDRLDGIASFDRDLADEIVHIRLDDLPRRELRDIVFESTVAAVETDGTRMGPNLIEDALTAPEAGSHLGHPGLAIERIEAAAARARQQQARVVGSEHLEFKSTSAAQLNASEIAERLKVNVRGQDEAIDSIAERLAPSLIGLKLRPERPHGVFFFAGPTGCGKTELARRLAEVVYGSPDALIRLDMSEYADEKDARMKLIGASRIWKDSTTEGLLTTRINQRPRTVILLDEFEKAHPDIWPLFLQAFDEGRMTDGWGIPADFSQAIVIMTSNLGAKEGNARSAGFGATGGFDSARQHAVIIDTLPPEFRNRITEIVAFHSLSKETIRELAVLELDQAFVRFARAGWQIDYTDRVATWIASRGYDPQLGARHLQRNIERELLPRLAAAPDRRVHLDIDGDALAVTVAK